MAEKRPLRRNIYLKNWSELPTERMHGSIILKYTGRIIFSDAYDDGVRPSSFDPEQDLEITCGCDFEELAGFEHVEKA